MVEQFGEFYRNTREVLGLTQSELAERLDCSVSTVSRMENGRAIRGTLAENLPKVLPVPDHVFAWTKEEDLRREICQKIEEEMADNDLEHIDITLHRLLALGDDDKKINRQYFEMYKAFWYYMMTKDKKTLERLAKAAIGLTYDFDEAVCAMKEVTNNIDYGRRLKTQKVHAIMSRVRESIFTRPEILLLNAYAISRFTEKDGFITKIILIELLTKLEANLNPWWEGLRAIVLYNIVYAHYKNNTLYEAQRLCKKLLKLREIKYRSHVFLRTKMLEYKINCSIEKRDIMPQRTAICLLYETIYSSADRKKSFEEELEALDFVLVQPF